MTIHDAGFWSPRLAAVLIALVAFACQSGGSAQAPATVPAGQDSAAGASVDESAAADDVPLDEDICLGVLAHGEASGGGEGRAGTAGDDGATARGVDIVQPDQTLPRYVCLVDIYRASERGGVYTLGVIVRREQEWVVLESESYTYEQYEAGEDDPEGMQADASASIELVAIAPDENAVVSRLEWSESGLEYSQTVEDVTLFRVTEDGRQVLLSLESRAGGSEVGKAAITQTFEIAKDQQSQGYYDIRVTESHEEIVYMGDEKQTSKTGETWYRWNGETYVQAEP